MNRQVSFAGQMYQLRLDSSIMTWRWFDVAKEDWVPQENWSIVGSLWSMYFASSGMSHVAYAPGDSHAGAVSAAAVYVGSLPDESQVWCNIEGEPIADGDTTDLVGKLGVPAVAPDWVDTIAENLQYIIASSISQIIDAGSERDAVMENEELYNVIRREVAGWSTKAVADSVGG